MTVKKQQEPGLSICLPNRANPSPYLSVNGLDEQRLLSA